MKALPAPDPEPIIEDVTDKPVLRNAGLAVIQERPKKTTSFVTEVPEQPDD